MKIVYTGGPAEVTVRDILDPAYQTWRKGEVRDVPADAMVTVLVYGEEDATESRSAIEAIFNCGPAFVNADTGKNPLHVCTTCGGAALGQGFRPAEDFIEYATPDGDPQCPACFLAQNPEHIAHHRDLGASKSLLAAVADRAAQPPAPAAPAPIQRPAVVSKSLDAHDEEN